MNRIIRNTELSNTAQFMPVCATTYIPHSFTNSKSIAEVSDMISRNMYSDMQGVPSVEDYWFTKLIQRCPHWGLGGCSPHPTDWSRGPPSATSKGRSTGRAKALFTSYEAWKKTKGRKKKNFTQCVCPCGKHWSQGLGGKLFSSASVVYVSRLPASVGLSIISADVT